MDRFKCLGNLFFAHCRIALRDYSSTESNADVLQSVTYEQTLPGGYLYIPPITLRIYLEYLYEGLSFR
jgi:hypothetical protein